MRARKLIPTARLALALAFVALCSGCAVLRLASYAVFPDYPQFQNGDVLPLVDLRSEVEAAQRPDGLWRISAANEHDAMLVLGYLQARDRMAQLDIFRHIARGELAALIGNERLGDKTALEMDRLNRFLGFREKAQHLYDLVSFPEREALDAFVRGINLWITRGHLSLEHRLLGVEEVEPWTPVDSLAIYEMVMHSLSSNADREIRRLLIACEIGLDALERVWPTDFEYETFALPEEDLRDAVYPLPPAVVPELAEELPALCAEGRRDRFEPTAAPVVAGKALPLVPAAELTALSSLFSHGWSASNNWVVSGGHTSSGKPILSNDPHLPHMNPPMLWGAEVRYEEHHVAGFLLPGLHRVAFGHNGHVAWGATTNHVDRQDLVVHRSRSEDRNGRHVEGYELEGEVLPFEYREEVFQVRGSDPVRAVVRFTRDGPLLNDLEPFAAGKIPLTALRVVSPGRGTDVDAARVINYARSADELVEGISLLDLGCSSWVFADSGGTIGLRSPCLVPIRKGWRGTFPVPGWLRRYQWKGVYPKGELPASTNPERGWIATANSQIVPSTRFPTAYNNDASNPNRFLRISHRLRDEITDGGRLNQEESAAIQLDVSYERWPEIRASLSGLCSRQGGESNADRARRLVCAWDGAMRDNSVAATLYVLLTHALLDRAMADELPQGRESPAWRYAQSLLMFEANIGWLWSRAEDAALWDDARTPAVESRAEILEAALADAVAEGTKRWGSSLAQWEWGTVRPFVLRHLFAAGDGMLGRLLNSEPLKIPGGNETPFKQQFSRSDREHMSPAVGPLVRFTVDMAQPWAATYTFAGGESGWPQSPYYGNLLRDWRDGRGRLLTPSPSPEDVSVRFVRPAGEPDYGSAIGVGSSTAR